MPRPEHVPDASATVASWLPVQRCPDAPGDLPADALSADSCEPKSSGEGDGEADGDGEGEGPEASATPPEETGAGAARAVSRLSLGVEAGNRGRAAQSDVFRPLRA
jgi:hypothetical protein